MPHLAGQDAGRPVRAAARRARRPPREVGRPRVFVVSGPSGAGKGTLIQGVLPRMPALEVAVSATTRPMRPGEVDGRDYYFLAPDRFAQLVREDKFLEHVEYAGNHYGTLRSEIDRIIGEGRSCVVEIELRGARAVRRALPDCVAIFIQPPSLAELERRLQARGTEAAADIAARLEVGREELQAMHEFDHRIRNEDVERATEDLRQVMAAAVGCAPTASGP